MKLVLLIASIVVFAIAAIFAFTGDLLSDRGDGDYCAHVAKLADPGTRVRAGGRSGITGDSPGNAPGADHVHVGHHKGDSPEAHYQSALCPVGCYLTTDGPPPTA